MKQGVKRSPSVSGHWCLLVQSVDNDLNGWDKVHTCNLPSVRKDQSKTERKACMALKL